MTAPRPLTDGELPDSEVQYLLDVIRCDTSIARQVDLLRDHIAAQRAEIDRLKEDLRAETTWHRIHETDYQGVTDQLARQNAEIERLRARVAELEAKGD